MAVLNLSVDRSERTAFRSYQQSKKSTMPFNTAKKKRNLMSHQVPLYSYIYLFIQNIFIFSSEFES